MRGLRLTSRLIVFDIWSPKSANVCSAFSIFPRKSVASIGVTSPHLGQVRSGGELQARSLITATLASSKRGRLELVDTPQIQLCCRALGGGPLVDDACAVWDIARS